MIIFTSLILLNTSWADEDIDDEYNEVVKYGSEKGFEVSVDAVQVLGGYGYCTEYGMEQFISDTKISKIWNFSDIFAIFSLNYFSYAINPCFLLKKPRK